MNKAQELSVLCKVDVNISIYDRKMNKVTEFASNPGLTIKDIGQMMTNKTKSEHTNQNNTKTFKHKLITSHDLKETFGEPNQLSKLNSQSNIFSEEDNEVAGDGLTLNQDHDAHHQDFLDEN